MCDTCGCEEHVHEHAEGHSPKLAVVAIGGNSLIKDKDNKDIPAQVEAAVETCKHIAKMIEMGWNVVITHGNGPQVGFVLRRSELAASEVHEMPLDYCGSNTQGEIGYIISRALNNQFRIDGVKKDVATIVTQVLVDKDDEAFKNPRKPIGTFMDKEEADRRVADDKWDVIEDSGRGFRRVVASPIPQEIIEEPSISTLVNHGTTVIAVGGGGIPVIRKENGFLEGVAAVIDKDHASSLLASNLKANVLLISTAVEQVCINFGKENEEKLSSITVKQAKQYLEEGHFAPGSMAPKIQACINFLENGGENALITTPAAIPAALRGETGTWIVAD